MGKIKGQYKVVAVLLLVLILFIAGYQYIKSPSRGNGDQSFPELSPTNNPYIPPTASDSLEAEFTVLNVNSQSATVRIDRIISYSRDKNAYYDEIKAGDERELHLPFGSGETDTGLNDKTYGSRLVGLRGGEKLRGAIAGCPDKCNGGKGWALFLYKRI